MKNLEHWPKGLENLKSLMDLDEDTRKIALNTFITNPTEPFNYKMWKTYDKDGNPLFKLFFDYFWDIFKKWDIKVEYCDSFKTVNMTRGYYYLKRDEDSKNRLDMYMTPACCG